MTDETLTLGANAQEKLRSYARRLNSLLDQKDELAEDTKGLMKEVKDDGFEPKVLREVAKRMRADQREREEFEAKVVLYQHAIQGELFADDADDVRATIEAPGLPPVETTIGAMKLAASRTRRH